MSEEAANDGNSAHRDRGSHTSSHIPDINRFIPATLTPRAPEHPGVERFSLFVPADNEDYHSYDNLRGRVIDHYDGARQRFAESTTDTPAETRQIPAGTLLTTIEIPTTLGGRVHVALVPAG